LEYALIENMQRSDLTAMEEAETFQRLMDEFSHTQEDLSAALGKSRTHIANTLRLLNLPNPVKEMMRQHHTLSAGHARALLAAKNPLHLANEVVNGGLSVRQTENLAKLSHGQDIEAGEGGKRVLQRNPAAPMPVKKQGAGSANSSNNADIQALEREVASWLGLSVALTQKGNGGTLQINYQTLEQLEDVLKRLSLPPKE
jgi:ParB family transcriptional regulator, chromosome partitioning protein